MEKEKKSRSKYQKKYTEEHYKKITVLIKLDEWNVIKKLESVDSMSEYIVDLIKADIRRKALYEKRKEKEAKRRSV